MRMRTVACDSRLPASRSIVWIPLLELLRDTRGVLLEPLTPACHAYM